MHKHSQRNRYLAIGFFLGLATLGGWYLVSRSSSSYAAVATIDKQVAASADDAYHTQAGWPNYSHTDGVVYAGAPGGSGPTVGGWRWTSLNIPAGAAISNAYVEFTQSEVNWPLTTTLAFQDLPNPPAFSSTNSPYHRWSARTVFNVSWQWRGTTPGASGAKYQTPNLAQGIQELVNKYGALDSIV